MSMYRKDEFDTGEMRDGHKLIRNACDEDGIDVIHPAGCKYEHTFGGEVVMIDHPACPWNMVWESYEGPLHAYAEGHESADLVDLDAVLPRGVEVPVVWRYDGGANWTDYGWGVRRRVRVVVPVSAMIYDENWVHPARTTEQARCVGRLCQGEGLPGKLVMACTLNAEGLCANCRRGPGDDDRHQLRMGAK